MLGVFSHKSLRAIFLRIRQYGIETFFKNPSLLHLLLLLWSISIPEGFFGNFDDSFSSYDLLKFQGIFSKNWFSTGRATLTQIIFRNQHKHTSFLPKYWYIMDIHHKKWKTSMSTCWLLTLAMPKTTKFSK